MQVNVTQISPMSPVWQTPGAMIDEWSAAVSPPVPVPVRDTHIINKLSWTQTRAQLICRHGGGVLWFSGKLETCMSVV